MDTSQPWDVVVVGAGIGGMALATRLGQKGFRVALVEKQKPGTFRVGESLDWEAPVFLRRLGFSVEEWVQEGKATFKGGAVATSTTQPGVEAEVGFRPGYRLLMTLVGRRKPTIHANRELTDIEMANGVKAAGVEWICGKARTIRKENDRIDGIVLEDGSRLQARFYVDATGSAGLFRKTFGIGQDAIGPQKVVVRARFPHPYDGRGTRIRTDDSLTEPAWIWDINVSQEITDIGIVVAAPDFKTLRRQLPTLREIFLHQIRKHDDFDWLEPLITEETPFWTCAFQDMVSHRSSGENWIAVGEAAFVVDAILSSGFTMSIRTGFFASDILAEALSNDRNMLCPLKRHIYHEKTACQVRSIDRLIDVLWYRGRLREHYPLVLNVVSILMVNFNLNHLHTRFTPRTRFGLRMLQMLHRTIDACVPVYNNLLTQHASRRKSRQRDYAGIQNKGAASLSTDFTDYAD